MASGISAAEAAATRPVARPAPMRRRPLPAAGAMRGRRRWRRVPQVVLLAVALAAAAAGWRERTAPLRALGRALVHEDEIRRGADVAVVSMANPRGAALDAAKLHRRGLVRAVWIPRWRDEPVDRRVDALGVHVPRHHEVARAILERAGVPSSAIVMLDGVVSGLEGEMATVGRALRARPTLRPIVLTSRTHTARARLLLHEVYAPAARARVRAPHTDRFDPGDWWRSRSAIREVLLESLKWIHLLVHGPVSAG